ncbi:MAG: hypothetical protein JW841_17320 [Deltaproteobacteria bacterium]|nr:hypothetical protein [Deltaproteobacteria bacterium]
MIINQQLKTCHKSILRFTVSIIFISNLIFASCSHHGTNMATVSLRKINIRPDSNPVLKREFGSLPAAQEKIIELNVTSIQKIDAHIYIEARDHQNSNEFKMYWPSQPIILNIINNKTSYNGIAVTTPNGVIIRLAAELKDLVSRHINLQYLPSSYLSSNNVITKTPPIIKVVVSKISPTIVDSTEAIASPMQRFYKSIAEAFSKLNSGAIGPKPFYTFAYNRLNALSIATQKSQRLTANSLSSNRIQRAKIGDLMSLYTGWLSVEEALQTDRALLFRGPSTAMQTIALSTLKEVPLTEHPWNKMLTELPNKPQPIADPLSAYVPNDVAYVHFHDLRTLVLLMNDVEQWASPLAQIIDNKPGATHFVQRYEQQLAIEKTGLAEKLGHIAADGIAMVASDPFFREGTDVSLLFKIKNQTILETALNYFSKRARERRGDAAISSYTEGGYTIHLLATKDRDIYQHRLQIDDVLIISNSRSAIKRFIAVKNGKLARLQDSGDYLYMRALYPFNKDKEDGFAFIGDAFVAHTISPRIKILQSRRMQAQADLATVGYTALLYGLLEGKPPKYIKDILDASLLLPEELVHADGSNINLDIKHGTNSPWGTLSRLVPLAELTIDKVTPEEAQAYQRFSDTYQRNWTGFIDPIAARLKRNADGKIVEIDARMLPLIDQSEYNDLIRIVGQRYTSHAPQSSGASVTLAIGAEAKLRRQLDKLSRKMTSSRDLNLGWLGDWVAIGTADRSGLWDAMLWSHEIPTLQSSSNIRDEARTKMKDILGHLPFYVSAHIQNKLAFAATLVATRGYADSAAAGMFEWMQDKPYRSIPITLIQEPQVKNDDDSIHRDVQRFGIKIYYATVADIFIAALEREVIEEQIDDILDELNAEEKIKKAQQKNKADNNAQTPNQPKEGEMQASVSIRPISPNGWLIKSLAGLLEKYNLRSNQDAYRTVEILMQSLKIDPTKQEDLRRLGLAYFGYEPRFASGGSFKLSVDGQLTHSIYGSNANPVLPDLPVKNAPVSFAFEDLEALKMSVSFEGEGNHRGLHTNILWHHKAKR